MLVLGLGLIGYYLSSVLDSLRLQYISAGLERLILFLYVPCQPPCVSYLSGNAKSLSPRKIFLVNAMYAALCNAIVLVMDMQGAARLAAIAQAGATAKTGAQRGDG